MIHEYLIVNTLNESDQMQLIELYRNEFWCNTRQCHDVETMLKNTDIVVGVKTNENELIGFVRVLTDYVYKATIYDLIVHPNWRKRNVGKLLMDTIISHRDLKNIEHIDLSCLPAMCPFYEKWGFTTEMGELGFMRKFNKKNRVDY